MAARSSRGAARWDYQLGSNADKVKVVDPLGYERNVADDSAVMGSGDAVKDEEKHRALVNQRMMGTAYAPGKQIFMTGLMLYMSGGGIHIFSIMMTAMAMRTPITSLMNTNLAFKAFEAEKVDLMVPKIIYILGSLAGLAMGMYRLGTMGLLPVTAADWFQLIEGKRVLESSAAAIAVGGAQ